jgi:hypothetical protein
MIFVPGHLRAAKRALVVAAFVPVTDDDLARSREDPAFRRRLLGDSLELLLARLQKLRKAPPADKATAGHIREGVQLAVKLAELIQADAQKAA